jgi:G3E family GTPase
MNKTVPIHIFSGFLGSGKTTLLKKALDYYTESGKKPVVIMNEIGDVNLDGLIVGDDVPMAEMLSGCICCTIRGDLGMTIQSLYLEHQPDVILIESTGVANPIEIIEGVTDASLILKVDLKSIITVVDAPHLLTLSRGGNRKTYRLMQDQIRCASMLIINKTDKVSSGELHGLEGIIRGWNPYASIHGTEYCSMNMNVLDELNHTEQKHSHASDQDHKHDHSCEHTHKHDHACEHHHHDQNEHENKHHHTHDHVMVYTHYFDRPLEMDKFEGFISKLPKEVYRAKGILHFKDSSETNLHLFQYAYREVEFIKINPKAIVPNVAVFIGENFSREAIKSSLDKI